MFDGWQSLPMPLKQQKHPTAIRYHVLLSPTTEAATASTTTAAAK